MKMRPCFVALCAVFFVTIGIICASPIERATSTKVSLFRNQRSLNDFMACLSSCTKAHTDDIHNTASEASIRLFCNQSCFMTFENSGSIFHHHHSDPDTTSLPGDPEGVIG